MSHRIFSKSRNPKSPNFSSPPLMSKPSFSKCTIALCIILLISVYVVFTTFPDSTISPSSKLASSPSTTSEAHQKPRIFMYDLPAKFTTGIIKHHALVRGSAKVAYPGHQHMGEWYLYCDLKRPESERSGSAMASPVIKVEDPEEADLFYVPVFSSLSSIVNPTRPLDPWRSNPYSDEEMQDTLVQWLAKQKYWKRYNGRDHIFMAGDPNALYKIIDQLKNAVLLVSDFGRLRSDQASLVKDVIVPYAHRIRTYNGHIGVEKRTNLLFFMGNRYRKDGGKIRDTLFQMLENEDDVIVKHGTQSRENRRAAAQGMHSSRFCLTPAGDTPSACRLFDSIVSLCVPVIISDSIELPFEDVIDYKKIAIFIETRAALKPNYLISLLRSIATDRILEYQKELRKVNRYFEYDNPNGTVSEIWREVAQKLPLIKMMINRDKRFIKRDNREQDCSCLCTNQTILNSF